MGLSYSALPIRLLLNFAYMLGFSKIPKYEVKNIFTKEYKQTTPQMNSTIQKNLHQLESRVFLFSFLLLALCRGCFELKEYYTWGIFLEKKDRDKYWLAASKLQDDLRSVSNIPKT